MRLAGIGGIRLHRGIVRSRGFKLFVFDVPTPLELTEERILCSEAFREGVWIVTNLFHEIRPSGQP